MQTLSTGRTVPVGPRTPPTTQSLMALVSFTVLVAASLLQVGTFGMRRSEPTAPAARAAASPSLPRIDPAWPVVERTATSTTWRRPDGRLVGMLHGGQVNWQTTSGEWLPLDLTLREDADGGVRVPTVLKPYMGGIDRIAPP